VFVSYENSTFLKIFQKPVRLYGKIKSENDHHAESLESWHQAMNGGHSRYTSGKNREIQKPVASVAPLEHTDTTGTNAI
jgi:hypothetical protein